MERDLYYTIEQNGYHIYDRNDPLYHIHQYEPYIPDKTKTYEENAQAQIHEFMVSDYAGLVMSGEITINEVPDEYKEEVNAIIAAFESQEDNLRQEGYEQALMDLAETTGGTE